MATIKSFTSLEQSKKLAKFLPLESADMYYLIKRSDCRVNWEEAAKDDTNVILFTKKVMSGNQSDYRLPCWSLAALLNIIPKHIMDYNVLRIDINEHDTSIWYDEIGFGVNIELPDITKESTVDACVAMILKLHELNLL